VSATINTMLTGASPTGDSPAYDGGALAGADGLRNFVARMTCAGTRVAKGSGRRTT
jgi:hypothetical protein